MSLINYTKYKISIDPKAKKVQGLQAGDIIRRQYFDGKNIIYSLMAVLDTGIDKIANENGVLEDSPYFVGLLLDGDIPSSDQVLDFARMTNLFNADRSGALYLTASDSEAPYMSVLDKLGTEKSLCIPFLPGNTPSIASKDKYHAILNSNGTYSYQKYLDGAYRVFSVNKTSSGSARIKTTFEDTLKIQNVVIISYKIKATKSIASLPFKFGYTDDSKYEAEGTVNVSTTWEYKFHLVGIDQTPRDTRSFTIVLDNAPNSTISVAELNIIKLSDIANFTNANKATIGKIGQIVDPVFGTLKGYGVYSQNLYATQNVGIAGTLTAGDENGFSSTFYAGRIQKNLIRNSLECDFQGTATLLTNENLPARIGNAYKFTTANMHTLVCREAGWASDNENKIVTFSMWIKGTKDLTVKVYQNTNLIDSFDIEVGWRRYTTTFPIYSTADKLTMRFETTEQLIVCSPQLEFGEYATQYQPTDDTLSDDSESYGFWACKGGIGGTIQNPLLRFSPDGSIRSKNDSFIINNDGTGQFANGRFAWTEDTITLKDVTIRWEDLTPEAQNNLSSKGVKITGRNVFYYGKDGTVDNNITTLTVEEINIVPTSRKWEYLSPDGSWVSAGSTSTSLLLSDTSSIWSQKNNLSIRYTAIVNNKEYYDLINVYKVYNGADGSNGKSYYTWIRYADSSTGSGISNDPTNKKYIGFAYNKTTATESNTPSDYTWSLIKGTDGVPGTPGKDGKITYTWIAYSDNPDGSGMYQTPTESTKYIGIAVNKATATEGTNYKDYTWSLFKGSDGVPGKDGVGISSIDELYAVSSSKTIQPSGWYGDIPEMTPTNKYLWNKERINFSDGTKKESVQIIGVYGDTGSTGNGISSITNYYLATTASSGVTTSTSGWSTNVSSQAINASKPYLWGYESISYTNGNSKVTTPHIIGHFGKDGTNGKDANLLDWVSDWNTNKTEINGNQVITPKIFAGTKNSDGTLTGLALGNLPVKIANPSGGFSTQTINGIYGFNKGSNTWFLDSNGNAQLGKDQQYVKYNASTGKVEFGKDVVLGWGNIDSSGIDSSIDNKFDNSMFTQYTKNSDGTFTIPNIEANGVTVKPYWVIPTLRYLTITTSYATNSTVSQYYIRLQASSICDPLSFSFKISRLGESTGNLRIRFGENNNNIITRELSSSWITVKFENIIGIDSKYIYIGFTGSGTFLIQYPMLTNSTTAREWKLSNKDTSDRLTEITSTGIYTGTLNAEQVITATLKADSIQTQDLQAKFITADIINTLELTTKKGTLANWKIEENYLYSGTKQTSDTSFATSGITLYSDGTSAAIRAKNFRIDTNGNAYLKGYIESSSGLIGGWKITNKGLKHEYVVNSFIESVIYIESNGTIANAQPTVIDGEHYPSMGEQYTFWRLDKDGSGCLAKGNIKWDKNGKVTFGKDVTVNATVDTSKINAVTGTIGKWNINANSIYTGTEKTSNGFSTSGITLYSNGSNAAIRSPQFRIDTDGNAYFKGTLSAATGSFSGEVTATSGKIGGWGISSNNINNGTLSINSTGTIKSTNKWTLSQNNGLTMYKGQKIESQFDSDHYNKLDSGGLFGSNKDTVILNGQTYYFVSKWSLQMPTNNISSSTPTFTDSDAALSKYVPYLKLESWFYRPSFPNEQLFYRYTIIGPGGILCTDANGTQDFIGDIFSLKDK